MLNSKLFQLIQHRISATIILVGLFIFSACMPQSPAPRVDASKSSDSTSGGGKTSPAPNYGEPSFPVSGTFIQEGSTRTSSVLTLPKEFSDSFLIRGLNLSQYLRKLPNTTKFCLVGKYNYITGKDKFLILAAKPKSYTDLINKTTEYYLQVEPGNDSTNQNDCLVYNLTNELFSTSASPSAHFSLNQLCTDCSTSVQSGGLKLYFISGEEVPTLNLSALILNISGTTSSTGNTCVENSACQARGYDCCLQSQCVNDGAVKPGATTLTGFSAAQEDVRVNPSRFVVYPQYYFVCDSRPEDTTGSTDGGTTDPAYEAAIRLQELHQLYQCLNKVDGEFSYCTVKFTGASQFIPGDFSPSSLGRLDDVNFSSLNSNLSSGFYVNNIVKVSYAGKVLYEYPNPALTDASWVTGSGSANDNLTSAQAIRVTSPLPANAIDDNLYLTYKVDGTCEKLGSSLARCTKTYIQGSSDTFSTTYHDNSTIAKATTFLLPSYANLSTTTSDGSTIEGSVIVKVGGIIIPEDPATWSKYTSPNRVVFVNAPYPGQKIEITYFVTNSTSVTNLTSSRSAAQSEVNSMCACSSSAGCNLRPVYNESDSLSNFECVFPSPATSEPPANQTVNVSNKNVPHRFFDEFGVNYDEDMPGKQELTPFSYESNNLLKPSNVSNYVGFNEIYGSFTKLSSLGARPAKMVRVKKDKTYDIIISTGSFSSCSSCGSDYYSMLQKIFPQNFGGRAGGYTPDKYESSRLTNNSIYRSDDLLYGRACFVPATMLPWTHVGGQDPKVQRQSRLSAQHLLFANGYNRDWFGFDYGSLIGSFDGVSWFSIGNSRRIKARTGKLFLAVNAYYGDQSVDNSFTINVSEITAFSVANMPEHDTATDGAECQKSHYCSTDKDCINQLGYDYTCQNVAAIVTSWPQFDANAAEASGSTTRTLASIIGGTNGQSKRCVYRGRGAPCDTNLLKTDPATYYNSSSLTGMLACSPNNSCQPLTSARFNDRIARFAASPSAQNSADAAAPSAASDLVGLGARILGRPFDFYGTKAAPGSARTTLSQNLVNAMCVPGKNVSSSMTTFDANIRYPASTLNSSDKLYGVGATMPHSTLQSSKYLNACPANGSTGSYLHHTNYSLSTSDELASAAISQNLSSNLLNLTPLTSQGIYSNNTVTGHVSTVGYQRNTCLRAPGASCFSDMECAPSDFVAGKVRAANFTGILNSAEENYWEEELVCGNPDFKFVNAGALNPNYDIKKNRCCREIGKTLTVFTQTQANSSSPYTWCDTTSKTPLVAGVNTSISSVKRYSRVHTAYDKMTCDPAQVSSGKTFALSSFNVSPVDAMKQILEQYKTLDTINQRTCCTTHWVRKFHPDNGGGTLFSRGKLQTVDKEMFKHVSWFPQDTSIITDTPFECNADNYANSSCEVKSFTPAEEELYLRWAGSLELLGIPQVAVMTNDQVFKLVDDNQDDATSSPQPLNNSIVPVTSTNADFEDDYGKLYYSAGDQTKFTSQLKKVFSENEFNCCIPSGQQVTDTSTADQCCTGFIGNINNVKRCCLPDFTDVTVYLNRYVSSEGRGLPDSAYDTQTGYIKDPGQVKLMEAQKNLCCSGRVMTGVAISQLSIPIEGGLYKPADQLSTTRRLNYRTDAVDNNPETGNIGAIFDAGVRWNNHVYCVPAGFAQ